MDVFRCKIVGYDIFEAESAEHATHVVTNAYLAEELREGGMILHSDNCGLIKDL